jgi:hypothetical protein
MTANIKLGSRFLYNQLHNLVINQSQDCYQIILIDKLYLIVTSGVTETEKIFFFFKKMG